MASERVVELLRSHRVRIARALVRQTRALAPRYEQLDENAQERNFMALLVMVENLVAKGADGAMLDQVGHLAQMRASMGFRVDDFVLASLSFLPVLRRFMIDHSDTLAEGISDYEILEAIALPFIGRAASIFLDAAEESTAPNVSRPAPTGLRAPHGANVDQVAGLRIERVTGAATEEDIYRDHPLFTSRG